MLKFLLYFFSFEIFGGVTVTLPRDECLEIQCAFVSLQVSNVSMIITDYCMPGMTGYELLKKIKVMLTFD